MPDSHTPPSTLTRGYLIALGSAAVLWDSATGLTFPLGKVQKFLDNGREDSVQFFAKVMIEKSE